MKISQVRTGETAEQSNNMAATQPPPTYPTADANLTPTTVGVYLNSPVAASRHFA